MLKDKSFRVVEVFMKKEARIEALSVVMVLCSFVYAVCSRVVYPVPIKRQGKR